MASQFELFMKGNKKPRENVQRPVTASLCDENGKPLLWTIRPLTTKENDKLREACTVNEQVPGKPNMTRPKFNSNAYINKLIVASVVEPNLHDKALQDSYGVMGAEELAPEIIDNPGEHAELAQFLQEFNGFNATLQDKVDEVKNS